MMIIMILHSDSSKVIVDVMYLFSRVWGEWSSYYKSYKYQNLITCANYYDFRFVAHDSLEDVKATLYCYHRVSYDCNFNIYDYIK